MKHNQKGFAPIIILIIIGLIVVAGGAYYYSKNSSQTPQEENSNVIKNSGTTTGEQQTTSNQSTSTTKIPVSTTTPTNTKQLKLDVATYNDSCAMQSPATCTSSQAPQSVQHVSLKVGDSFLKDDAWETGTFFQLVSFDDSKIVVKLSSFLTPMNGTAQSNGQYTFRNQACFSLNNWVDAVPHYCLSRTSSTASLNFDVISHVNP